DNEISVPISALMRRLTNVDTVSGARLLLKDPSRGEQIAAEVTRVLRTRHALAADDPEDFRLMTAVEVRQMTTWVRRVLLVFVPLLAAVILLVAAIVRPTDMRSTLNTRKRVTERRRSLGGGPVDLDPLLRHE